MIAIALIVAFAGLLAAFLAPVRADQLGEHRGATADWSPAAAPGAADECELDAVEAAALAAATEQAVAAALQAAAYAASGRSLTPGWRDLVQPEPQPQLFADLDVEPATLLPIVPGRPYVGRHHDDTVGFVAQAYRMPEEITDPWLAAFVGRPTRRVFDEVPDGH